MLDRPARDRLALALRRLASGRMTSDEYERATDDLLSFRSDQGRCHCGYEKGGLPTPICPECGRTVDQALSEIAFFGWTLYDDIRDFRLRGEDAPSREDRRAVARAVLFLRSDLEYTLGPVMRRAVDPSPRWLLPGVAVFTTGVLLLAGGTFWYWPLALAGAGLLVLLWVVGAAARLMQRARHGNAAEPEPTMPGGELWPFASAEDFGLVRRTPARLKA